MTAEEMAELAARQDSDEVKPLVAAAMLALLIADGVEPSVPDSLPLMAARRAVALLRSASEV